MLVGRERERAAVLELVERARGGRGGALVLQGLPGVGKSALLTETIDNAASMQVLRTSGIESESPLPFAALQRLLRPVMGHASALPAPQERALRAAFGEAEGQGDRFMVFLATLSLLAEAGESAPVLAVVDDAHWLDEASAAALLFVSRRLEAEPVALIFAARDADLRQFEAGDLPQLRLEGVGLEATELLLSQASGEPVSTAVARQLLELTGGNPLALVESVGSLTAEQLSSRVALPAKLQLTEGVERAFLGRYYRLPKVAQRYLLVVAADDSGNVSTIRRAAAALDAREDALHEVETSGLVREVDGRLELRHSLVRSAVYGAATSTERRQAHRALASVLTEEVDADRRAWHLAAAAEGPDPAVVAELDAAATRARSRGGHEAASYAWERSAELSSERHERARRLYAAAWEAWVAAQPSRARALAESSLATAQDPALRADASSLLARIEWNTGSLDAGHAMVLRAAAEVAPHDEGRARELALLGAALASAGAESATGINPVAVAAQPPEDAAARVRACWELLVGLDHVHQGQWGPATQSLHRAFALAEPEDREDQNLLPNLGIAALHLGDDERGAALHGQLLARARATGSVVMILYGLTRLGFSEIPTGAWSELRAGALEALPLAEGSGQPALAALPLAELTLLAAMRGEPDYEALLIRAERVITEHSIGTSAVLVPDLLHWARGVHAATAPGQDATGAATLHHLEQIRHPAIAHLSAIDRLTAAARADRTGLLREWAAELDLVADGTGMSWAAAAADYGRALLAQDPESTEASYQAALQHFEASGRVPDRARTQLAYGAWLRRARRRVDARVHLRAALATFEDIGAARIGRDRASP